MVHLSKSLQDTEKIATTCIGSLKAGKHATIVGLFGDLGSGKTTFTQAVAKKLGVTDTVTSPTFVIEKIYKITHQDFTHLIHIDAYRLESSKELMHLGWKEISENPKNLILLEWPEKVADILPSDMMHITFSFIDETTREITF
jgi:tRNA threonylcarbamoyladenosine biosynthesis protein TsaE